MRKSIDECLAVGMAQSRRTRPEIGGGRSFHRGSRIEHSHAVGKFKCEVDIMGDQDDAFSGVRHFPEHFECFQRLFETHTGGRLIGNDQLQSAEGDILRQQSVGTDDNGNSAA